MELDLDKLESFKEVNSEIIKDRIDNLRLEEVQSLDLEDWFKFIDYAILNYPISENLLRNKLEEVRQVYDKNPNLRFASICVYPNHLSIANEYLKTTKTAIAAVTGNFPFGQTILRNKLMETRYALDEGADEIDYIYDIGNMHDGQYQKVFDELSSVKDVSGSVPLKVIIESGSLYSSKKIRIASEIALQAGADFIKTSTGKSDFGASLEDAFTIFQSIAAFQQSTGQRKGIKISGGINNKKTAKSYIGLLVSILGKDWFNPKEFRFGAGGFAEKLMRSQLD